MADALRALVLYSVGRRSAPWENAYVESFHARVRLELLDRELFFNLREGNAATSNYAYEYNFKRPHGSLGQRPPGWPRSANFRSGLRPALQFALVLLP